MTNHPSIGFIGFGEAGFNIAKGLRAAGVERMSAYDIHTHTAGRGEKIQRRAREAEVALVESSHDIGAAADLLISVVTASSARDAARQTAPFLTPNHLYADMNSVSPMVKQELDRIVRGAGARFAEVAIMSPIAPQGHRTPMLLGGAAASEFVDRMASYGMQLEIMSEQVGTAAAVKMFRSIMIKGIEALAFECVLGASHYNAEKRVFDSIALNFPGLDWDSLASYMINRVVVHGERRAREMDEVAATLRELGVEPIMAEATARRQDWSARLDLASRFEGEGPTTYKEVVEELAKLSTTASR